MKTLLFFFHVVLITIAHPVNAQQNQMFTTRVEKTLRKQVMAEAAWAMRQLPITVIAASSPRSSGGAHDFFSEGDYWWPNPVSPDSPYLQRDGMTNPDNFTAHRSVMTRFSRIAGALASAYLLTGNKKYIAHALTHYKAWFIDTATLMHPHLLYAQAIKGRFTGRSIGVIDGIQLMETAQAMLVMQQSKAMDPNILQGTKTWFNNFLQWLSSHRYGIDEMNAVNNHGTCWVMQAAVFARFTGNAAMLEFCRDRFKNNLLPNQMAADGSFPLEMKRTKPYGYAIFNLDAMATICQALSTRADNLWTYRTPDGRTMERGLAFLYPFVQNKKSWPLKPDVMYWNEWPVAQPFLLFGANAFNNPEWFNAWQHLDHAPQSAEVIRNLPVRHPLIWLRQ
ncbi:MAG: alginate lyase family protein [Chitinophagaceae bacterium]